MPRLSRITIFPIKSLDGVEVESCDVLPSSTLALDRRWALLDSDDCFVNGKRCAAIHAIRSRYDLGAMTVELAIDAGRSATFSLADDLSETAAWFSDALQTPCRLAENRSAGFPDDTEAPGPTIIATETLREVAKWFPDWTIDEARRRFRANLEIDAPDAFWEDRLTNEPSRFALGGMKWHATGVCQRCVVPSRDSQSGVPTKGFQKSFSQQRRETLPSWAPQSRFDHYYRLAINTRLAGGQPGGTLQIGDELTIAR
ncbi:MAG: MOSC N-terminal beta barrel domain-containing protein [Planctomycetota bacterium]